MGRNSVEESAEVWLAGWLGDAFKMLHGCELCNVAVAGAGRH
jgi:hypothetical protein